MPRRLELPPGEVKSSEPLRSNSPAVPTSPSKSVPSRTPTETQGSQGSASEVTTITARAVLTQRAMVLQMLL